MSQEQLARAVFPLGDLTKSEVRARAARAGLPVADKKESMEICFIPGDDYSRFVESQAEVIDAPGEVVDESGRVLGRHRGIHRYTIGQRRGLGIAASEPLYVIELRPETRQVLVGKASALDRTTLVAERVNWLSIPPPESKTRAQVKIRSRHSGGAAWVEPLASGRARVEFDAPPGAISPGQAAVFYRDDLVLGGGWIARARQ